MTDNSKPSETVNYVQQHSKKPTQRSGNKQSGNNSKRSSIKCFRCGKLGHTGQECRCSQGHTCEKYGKVGHFGIMCRSTNNTSSTSQSGKHSKPQHKHKVHHLAATSSPAMPQAILDNDSSDDEYVYSVKGTSTTTDCDVATVLIEEEPISMYID